MKRFSKNFNSFRYQTSEKGFTLTEVLISALIVTSAVAVSGMGMASMISSSQTVSESNERQDELNRTLEFISGEIRQAKLINNGAVPTTFNDDIDTSIVDVSTVKPILWLDMGLGENVVYYVAEPQQENGPWRSPQILFRWGAKYDASGNIINNPEHRVLMDSLHSQLDNGNPPVCPNQSDPDPNQRWSQPENNPDIAKNLGFYTCVAPNNRTAILSQAGHIRKVLDETEVIRQDRQVFSRSSQPPVSNQLNGFDATGGLIAGDATEESDITIMHKGGQITCGAGGSIVPIETSVIWKFPNGETTTQVVPPNGAINKRVPAGTNVSFSATRLPPTCAGDFTVDSEADDGTQVLALRNNDAIPFYRPFANQSSINAFIEENLNANGNLNIAENQRVFLFELGEVYSSNPTSAFDFQDVVLLSEITPVPNGSFLQ